MPARMDQFAEKGIHNRLKLAKMKTYREPKRMPDQRLANSSRTTIYPTSIRLRSPKAHRPTPCHPRLQEAPPRTQNSAQWGIERHRDCKLRIQARSPGPSVRSAWAYRAAESRSQALAGIME